jgi:hypothetical protein
MLCHPRGENASYQSDLTPIRSGKGSILASMAYVVDDLKTLKELSQ